MLNRTYIIINEFYINELFDTDKRLKTVHSHSNKYGDFHSKYNVEGHVISFMAIYYEETNEYGIVFGVETNDEGYMDGETLLNIGIKNISKLLHTIREDFISFLKKQGVENININFSGSKQKSVSNREPKRDKMGNMIKTTQRDEMYLYFLKKMFPNVEIKKNKYTYSFNIDVTKL